MTSSARKLLLWSPRILGILVAFVHGVFALDAFREGERIVDALPAFLIHAAPALLLLLAVAVSWRWEWVGGAAFIALAVLYGVPTLWRADVVTIGVISVPLLVVGVLFLLSWRHRKELRAQG